MISKHINHQVVITTALNGILECEKQSLKMHLSNSSQFGFFWLPATFLKYSQKQPPEVFCKKKCSLKSHKIHRKTPVPESATLLKKKLWHRCFPVNFVKFPWTPFSQNTSGRLLLDSSGKNNEACVIIVTTSTTFEFKMKKWKKKMNQKFVTAKMFRKLKTFDNNIKYTFLFWI